MINPGKLLLIILFWYTKSTIFTKIQEIDLYSLRIYLPLVTDLLMLAVIITNTNLLYQF